MPKRIKLLGAGIGVLIVTWAAGSAIVMLLWNSLLPRIFGFPQLNYPEALGIFALARILFGGLNGFGSGRGRGTRERGSPVHRANRLREKWMTMNEDERKEFIRNERDFTGLNRLHTQLHEFFDEEEEGKLKAKYKTEKENINE